ncbi:hypothetical protein C10C_0439 [Chlamydia serpentis]|uniref:Uncharacterized protein n=1 Tax=Chlamydia serpentis TaxID=1967782 RepID=A0A2R8FBD3_9CHLA|nr:hypothetical protein [Chlamydia serpentis]SPN73606.1 hypothetical protein C10C_0439 [Chlamydia serpentis]
MVSTPPSCPPPNKDNLYHLTTNPEDSLILRILRTIGYILLHIITLGLLLLIHYYKHHQVFRKEGLPTPPIIPRAPDKKTLETAKQLTEDKDDRKPSSPKKPTPTPPPIKKISPSPSIPSSPELSDKKILETDKQPGEDKDITPPAPPKKTTPPPIKKISPPPYQRQPEGVGSLNWMVNKAIMRDILPLSSQIIDPTTEEINPYFLASYPNQIKNEPGFFPLDTLKLLAHNPLIPSERRRIAKLALNQIEYLSANYYVVNVPGDGRCFYRSYVVGWLCALAKDSETNSNIFTEEAIRVRELSFASSSPENQALSIQVSTLLESCANYLTLEELYNKVILNPQNNAILVSFIQKLSTYTARRNIAMSVDEASARRIYVSDIEEALLPETLEFLVKKHSYNNLFLNLIAEPPLPSTNTKDQLLLLLGHLPALFLNDQELKTLDSQKQISRRQYELQVEQAFCKLSAVLNCSGWDIETFATRVKDNLPAIIKSQFTRFLQTIKDRRCKDTLPWSQTFSFFAFILTSPSTKLNKICKGFYLEIEGILNSMISAQSNLQDILEVSDRFKDYLKDDLENAWESNVTSSNMFSLLTMHDGLRLAQLLPSLKSLQIRVARLLKNLISASFENPPLSEQPEVLETTVNHLLSAIYTNTTWTSYWDQVCSSEILNLPLDPKIAPEKDSLYTSAARLLFFIFQHPLIETHPSTKQTVANLKMILLPLLQYAFKKVENQTKLKNLLNPILASIFLDAHKPSYPITTKDIQSFCVFFKIHPEIMILDPILELRCKNFANSMFPTFDLENQAKSLIKEIPDTHGNLWESFLKRMNTFSAQPLSDALCSSFLVFSFLENYPELLQKSSPITNKLQCFQKTALETFLEKEEQLIRILRPVFGLAAETLNNYSIFRRQMINHLLRKSDSTTAVFCHSAFRENLISYLLSLHSSNLASILDLVQDQAESSDVASMATVPLQQLAVCEAMFDSENTYNNIQSLAVSHGFLHSFSSEAEARIFLIHFSNHYGCLLPIPKTSQTEAPNNKTQDPNP